MPAIIEKIPVLKTIAKIPSQKQMMEDWMPLMFVCSHLLLYYWGMTCIIWIPVLTLWKPPLGILPLLYVCWIYYDRNTPRTGGRKSKWFCDFKFHDLMRKYFSNRLIKTADLPQGRNYILAYYPHGIYPFHVASNFLNGRENPVPDLFPGIEMYFVTTDMAFVIPIAVLESDASNYEDINYSYFIESNDSRQEPVNCICEIYGAVSCSESSFTYLLKGTPSKGVIVLPGGASEMKYSSPDGIYKIIKRRGFVRLALATGSPLVPVFTFGEGNAWTKLVTFPLWKPLENYIRNSLKSPIDARIAIGRGLLPKKVPVNTIVGAPISVPKVENPSKELIDEYCEKFFQALQDLFERHKHEYDLAGEKAKLIILEESA